jgi:hypothetical protein
VTRTTHTVDSLVPSWLQHDSGYRQALSGYLAARIAAQGDEPATPIRIRRAETPVPPPVGMVLLRAETQVEDFDIEVGGED